MKDFNECTCESGLDSRPIYDGYGIYLCRVCDTCEEEKLSRYRRDIFTCYTCDESIDGDY